MIVFPNPKDLISSSKCSLLVLSDWNSLGFVDIHNISTVFKFLMQRKLSVFLNFESTTKGCEFFLIHFEKVHTWRIIIWKAQRKKFFTCIFSVLFGFAQVYVYCSLDVALMRDAERTSPVGDETIVKMSSRIEEPDPGKFSWEKFSATIDTSQRLDIW